MLIIGCDFHTRYQQIAMWFTDGLFFTAAVDQDGQPSNVDATQVTWHYRRVDLTPFAGKTIDHWTFNTDTSTSPGSWDIYYEYVVMASTDGTVSPIYSRQPTVSLSVNAYPGMTGVGYEVNHYTGAWQAPGESTTYYHGDHLGSARLLTNPNGYPLYSGTFLPFSQEWNPQTTANHYKFAGKERDSESGLDNFGARFDSSSMGRFMSPDPKILSIRHIINPQKWNKYAYTLNNPLAYFDPDGQEEKSLLAKIADVFHVQGSTGVGLGVTVKVSGVKVEVEASMKSQGTLSGAGNVTTSVVKEAGVSVEAFKEVAVGYKKSSETVTVKDGKPVENFKTESTDVVGFSTGNKSNSVDDHNVEVIGAGVCVLLCGGVSVGVDTQKAGVAASAVGDTLADAIKRTQPPPPAPPPPTPPPACGQDKDKKC